MQIQYEYKNRPVSSFEDLILQFPVSEFDSPYRSSVPSLVFWKNAAKQLGWLSQRLGFETGDFVTLSFEYCVDVQRGTGRPSQTDLMILSGDASVAIEAKYTEPPYLTVSKWLGDSSNRRQVLEGWVALITAHTGNDSIRVKDLLELPYQMIHRCASACFPAVGQKFLVYQGFDLNRKKFEYYKIHMQRLHRILGAPKNLGFDLVNMPLIKSEKYSALQSRWDSKEHKLHREVIEGLMTPGFIRFEYERGHFDL